MGNRRKISKQRGKLHPRNYLTTNPKEVNNRNIIPLLPTKITGVKNLLSLISLTINGLGYPIKIIGSQTGYVNRN